MAILRDERGSTGTNWNFPSGTAHTNMYDTALSKHTVVKI